MSVHKRYLSLVYLASITYAATIAFTKQKFRKSYDLQIFLYYKTYVSIYYYYIILLNSLLSISAIKKKKGT